MFLAGVDWDKRSVPEFRILGRTFCPETRILEGNLKTDGQGFFELQTGAFSSVFLSDFGVVVVDHIGGDVAGEPLIDSHVELYIPADIDVLGVFQVVTVKIEPGEHGHVFQEFVFGFHA